MLEEGVNYDVQTINCTTVFFSMKRKEHRMNETDKYRIQFKTFIFTLFKHLRNKRISNQYMKKTFFIICSALALASTN